MITWFSKIKFIHIKFIHKLYEFYSMKSGIIHSMMNFGFNIIIANGGILRFMEYGLL